MGCRPFLPYEQFPQLRIRFLLLLRLSCSPTPHNSPVLTARVTVPRWYPLSSDTSLRPQFGCCFLQEAFHYSFPLFEPLAYTLSCYQSVVNDICVHAQLKGKAGIMLYPSPIPRAQQSLAHSRHSNYVCGVGPNDQNMGAKGSYLFWKDMKISS